MTSERSLAYGRVMKTLEDLGPAKLHDLERQRVRQAADALLFAPPQDPGAFDAITDIEHLAATWWTPAAGRPRRPPARRRRRGLRARLRRGPPVMTGRLGATHQRRPRQALVDARASGARRRPSRSAARARRLGDQPVAQASSVSTRSTIRASERGVAARKRSPTSWPGRSRAARPCRRRCTGSRTPSPRGRRGRTARRCSGRRTRSAIR